MANNLCRQIEDGNFSEVKEAVEAGGPINQYSAAGLTPLGTAILCGNLSIAQYLLKEGADIKLGYKSDLCQDKSRITSDLPDVCAPIHCASVVGSADLIRLLVDHGADVNDHSAIEYGAQVLPLYISIGDATKALIEAGADVSRKNNSGFTPLLHAIAREDVPSTRLLVENGADIEIERKTRFRMRFTLGNGSEDTEERLVEGTSSPLMVACHQGRLRPTSAQMIQILASAGTDVNRRYYIKNAESDISFTVLSLICGSRTPTPVLKGAHAKKDQYGEKEVAAIKALIAAGVDINNPPIISYFCQGEMPFDDFESRFEVLKMLVNHGMRVDPQSDLTPQSALLKSFTKRPDSEVQFSDMAALLAKAGARWDLLESDDELAVVPAYFRNDIQ